MIAIVLLEAALGLLSPLIGIQLSARDVPPFMIGIVSSAYFVGFLLGTLTCHRLIDRVGHIRTFAVLAVCTSNLTLLLTMIPDTYAWIAIRAGTGFSLAGTFVVIESWLNDKASEETRGRIFAVYMVLSWGAGGLSPLALNFSDPKSTQLILIAAILIAGAMIPLGLTKIGNPEVAHREHFGILRLFRISPLGVTCCFGSGFLNGAFYSLLPVYVEQKGHSPSQLSFLLSAGTAAVLFTQYPIGHIADHYGRRPIIIGICAASALIAFSIAGQDAPAFSTLLILFFLFTAFESPLYALGVGQTNDYVERKDFVAAASGLLLAWGIGAAISPSIAGIAMQQTGPDGLFLFMGIGFSLVAIFGLYRVFRRTAKRPAEQGNYVAAPAMQTAYGAPELDPRAEHPASGAKIATPPDE
jgi:MFS family permease